MERPKILVVGATGKTGAAVVAGLRKAGWPVRAVVRSRDSRSERLDRLGAETVVADLFDPDPLEAAIRGTSRAYYCPPMHPHMIQAAAAFATASRGSGLEVIVQMSQWLSSPSHPSLLTRQTWLADRLFAMIPEVGQVIVNPGYFADNYLRLIGFAAQLGIWPVLTGSSRNAPPSNEDIARVVVATLIDPHPHVGKTYRPTGPALLSARDMAPILENVLRRRVRAVEMPLWMFVRAARIQGVDPYTLTSLRHYIEDHKQGAFEHGAPTNDVELVTGRPAEDFETTARRYAEWSEARPTLVNRAKAAFDFLRTPFSPGYDLDRFDRDQLHPVPPTPRMAMQDVRWKAEHRSQAGRPAVASTKLAGAVQTSP